MFLKRIKVAKAGHIIQDFPFKDGLNLILDKTTDTATQSGNNVGKTTVLRLVDYCLGSDGDDIWTDPEFRKINQEVYDFLHGPTSVSVTLWLEGASGDIHEVERRFVAPRTKVGSALLVDGVDQRNITSFRAAVKGLLFGTESPKPTLRQLVPKFVRSSPATMGRTLKFLGDYGSSAAYEAIHLFLFGFFDLEVLEKRPQLDLLLKKQTRDLVTLTRDRKEGEIEQLLFHLRAEISDIEASSALKGEVPEIAARAIEISSVRSRAAEVSGNLSFIQAEISSVILALTEFKRDFGGIDSTVIAAVYKEAQSFIPELHAKWEELSDFVRTLRSRKERFLEAQLTQLEGQRDELLGVLNKLELNEARSLRTLADSPEFQEAIAIRSDLLERTKRLGSLEQDLEDIRALKSSIAHTEHALKDTQERIENGMELLQSRLKVFNSFFSAYSKLLYGEQYLLHTEKASNGTLAFKLSAVGANVGTGKKTSQTVAFDLAYCQFLENVGIHFPKFICHDGLEAVHDNQWRELLYAANKFGGQLIIATLRDKLPEMPEGFIKQNTVLELSQENRFFGI